MKIRARIFSAASRCNRRAFHSTVLRFFSYLRFFFWCIEFAPGATLCSGCSTTEASLNTAFEENSRLVFQERKSGGYVITSEIGNPAFGIVKQPNRSEVRIRAHIEPVPGVRGDRYQVILFTKH